MAALGELALVLHAHLPWVRHPEYPEFMEEDWLFEAITETYIPLLQIMERLAGAGLPFRLTMSLTPPLCEMLADPLLQARYLRHLENLIALSEKEVDRLAGEDLEKVARFYHEDLQAKRTLYLEADRNLLPRFKRLQDMGDLEILTCPATHGFLPLMMTDEAIRAQLVVAVRNYEKHFGRRPRGIWLSECAYRPGLEHFLADVGLRYFFVDTHGLLNADPAPVFGVAAPIFCSNGVAAFARDPESSEQVWSSSYGYPGDPSYREFYRDLGWDAEMEYIRPHLHADGFRRNLGIKYHRVTGKVELHLKESYDPVAARETAATHAAHFLESRRRQLRTLRDHYGTPPLIVSPYDAELYGHWWFEGPQFLDFFFRKALYDQDEVRLTTPAEYLERYPEHQQAVPSASTWGRAGYSEVWLNGDTAWMYPYLHQAERRMAHLARTHRDPDPLTRRALNQAARELLLAQSSDWAFIMTTGTTVPYAQKRFREHMERFNRLYGQIEGNCLEAGQLVEIEEKDNLFAEIDYRVYGPWAG